MIERPGELPIYAEADFTLTGTVETGPHACPKARSAITWAITAWPTIIR